MRSIASVYLLAGLSWTLARGFVQAQEQPPQAPTAVPAKAAQPASPAPSNAAAASPGTAPAGSAPATPRAPQGASPAAPPSAPAQLSAPAVVPVAGSAAPALPEQAGTAGEAPSGQARAVEGAAAPSVPAPQAPAPAAQPRLPRPPVEPAHDSERPVVHAPQEPSYAGFSARLSLGVGGALWISGGDTKLSRPFWFGLDLGYALTRSIVIMARASSWFPSDELANEFVGAGAVYRLVADGVYVAGALGLSLTRIGPASEWSHYVQGLALEADVGQSFPITTHTAFSVGAHFQFGSPLLGKKPDAFTSLQAGIFVAFGLR